MPDHLADILTKYLAVEDKSLRNLLAELLDLCQSPEGALQAILKLEAKRRKFSSDINFLKKAPYIYLFLAYAGFRYGGDCNALRWANASIEGFDQLGEIWNSAIARWICALIYRQSEQPDEAEVNFEAAEKLMKQEIQDLKRRSHYEEAAHRESALDQLLADAGLRQQSTHLSLPPSPPTSITPAKGSSPPRPPEDTVAILYQKLLLKVCGDEETARRLIVLERLNAPHISRVELIRRAIERLERDNQ